MPEKESVDDLAALGGRPTFDETLHVGRPNLGDRGRFLERVNEILDRRWLTNNGPTVQEFEQRVADLVGVRHCVAMCNATVALEIAARALDLAGEVIVPSFTFVATAHCLQWQEIMPVFCDVDPTTHNLDPGRIERLITPRTTGIIGVHLWGRACDVEALSEVADRHGLKLLFDAAHAFGCSHRGKMVGGFGQAEVFSFHATKFFNTLEGGAVATDDDTLAEKLRLMRNFGFSGLDNVIYVGTNGKMNEISAAMGLSSLETIETVIAHNRRNYAAYSQGLADLPGVSLLRYDPGQRHNYHYVILEVDELVTGISRDQLMSVLHAENIRARRYFYPACHRMEPYRSYYPNAGLLLPETERLASRVLALPTGMAVGEAEIAQICGILRLAVAHGVRISTQLGGAQ
jgi:dTDP-4-amino-4,6-dideoxygalactose transaminase